MKNIDKIRQMTVDELAEWLFFHNDCDICTVGSMVDCHMNCKLGIKQWLEQESEE